MKPHLVEGNEAHRKKLTVPPLLNATPPANHRCLRLGQPQLRPDYRYKV